MKMSAQLVADIRAGRKVVHFQTARPEEHWVAGERYALQTRVPGEGRPTPAQGWFTITSIRTVCVRDISNDDAQAAGFANLLALKMYFEKVLRVSPLPPARVLWRIEWGSVTRDDGIPVRERGEADAA